MCQGVPVQPSRSLPGKRFSNREQLAVLGHVNALHPAEMLPAVLVAGRLQCG